MNHCQTGTFFKGMGLGLMVVAGLCIGGKMMMGNHHNIAKGSGKVVKAVGDFVDGLQTMIK